MCLLVLWAYKSNTFNSRAAVRDRSEESLLKDYSNSTVDHPWEEGIFVIISCGSCGRDDAQCVRTVMSRLSGYED